MYYRTLFVIALFAVSAFAQSSEMSLDEAVKYALTNNKGLQADRQQIAVATGKMKQAALRANPLLDVSHKADLGDFKQGEFAIGLSLPLEYNGRRARRIAVAEQELERIKLEVAERERKLAAEVRTKYGEAVEAARYLELNEKLLELNQESLKIIKARVTEGASAPLEQSQLQVEVGRIEAQRATYASRVEVLGEELKNLSGMSVDEKIKVRDEFAEHPLTLTREQLTELALKSRPDLQAARAAASVAQALIAQAKAEGRFDLSVFTEFSQDAIGFDQLGLNRQTGRPEQIFMRSAMLKGGVTITLPTRNKNQGNIEAAVAMSEEARLRQEFIASVIRREIAAAYTRYEGAQRVLKIYNTDLLAAAQNNLRVMRASFDLGHVRLTEVLNEQRRLIEVQMAYTAALKEYFSARVELENVMGTAIEK